MRILAIDTSIGPASIAFVEGDVLLACHEDAEGMKQSERLVPAIDMLMEKQGGYDMVDALAVTTGPGGFTGIRVALAAARGLALATQKPLIGISTLETYGWQALCDKENGETALVWINAFRNQVYVQGFRKTVLGLEPLMDAAAVDYSAIHELLATYPASIHIGNLPMELLPVQDYHFTPLPHARFAAGYAGLRIDRMGAETAQAEHPVEAFYIRPPDAKPQAPLA